MNRPPLPCLGLIRQLGHWAPPRAKYLAFTVLTTQTALADTAEHDPLWQGIWAYQSEWCAFADKIGSHNPAPIRLSATQFDGYENSCTITQSIQAGDQRAWILDMVCQSEGSTYDEQILVMLADDDTLWQFHGAGAPTQFTRCKE